MCFILYCEAFVKGVLLELYTKSLIRFLQINNDRDISNNDGSQMHVINKCAINGHSRV